MINPLAAICAGGMLLEHLGEKEAAAAIERAVMTVCEKHIQSLSAGQMGAGTSEIGDLVASLL